MTNENKTLEEIHKGYLILMDKSSCREMGLLFGINNKFVTSKQILDFSKTLSKYKRLDSFESFTACYLTFLMHSSKDKEFKIDLTDLNNKGLILGNLGYELKGKILEINGNVGRCAGYNMLDSKLIINGDVGDSLGIFASNSKIRINGNYKDLGYGNKTTKFYQLKNGKWEKLNRK